MPELTPGILEKLLQLGSTAVVSIVAIWALVQVIKEKRNKKNNNDETKKALQKLEENHLKEMGRKLDELDRKGERTIELLIEIKAILKNK